MVWTDDPKGLSENLAVINTPNIGTNDNTLGEVYAQFFSGAIELPPDNFLNGIGSAGQSLDFIGADGADNTVIETPLGKIGKLNVNGVTIAQWGATGLTATAYNLADGSDKNHAIANYAAGTAYVMTNVSAALVFGTTNPTTVINKAGTYLLQAKVNLKYNGATFAAPQAVTLKLRRTNNTPADIANSTVVGTTEIITTLSHSMGVFALPAVLYTTAGVTDQLEIFGDVAVAPSAGSLDAIAAEIVAVRLF